MSIVEREESKLAFMFDTAWNIPQPIIVELVSWFPELTFLHEFYDEGGWFFGDRTYQAGQLVIDRYIDGDNKANYRDLEKRLSLELKGYDIDAEDEDD